MSLRPKEEGKAARGIESKQYESLRLMILRPLLIVIDITRDPFVIMFLDTLTP